jgi:hypothetical protein
MANLPYIRVFADGDKIKQVAKMMGCAFVQLWVGRGNWTVRQIDCDTLAATYQDGTICAVMPKSVYKRLCEFMVGTAFIELYLDQLFSGDIVKYIDVVEMNGIRDDMFIPWRGTCRPPYPLAGFAHTEKEGVW